MQNKEKIDTVITFKELNEIFNTRGIYKDDFNRQYQFDSLIHEYTKVYPISGGLAHTSHLSKYLRKRKFLLMTG